MRFECKGCGKEVEPVASDSPSGKELEDIRAQVLSGESLGLRSAIFAAMNMDAGDVWFGNQPKHCAKCRSVWHAACLADALGRLLKFEQDAGFVSQLQGARNRAKGRALLVRDMCPKRSFLGRLCRGRLQVFTNSLADSLR
jgi:hypothetical protein